MTIKSRIFIALRWIVVARAVGQAFTWAITIYVIHLLKPEDYGLMAMATVLSGFALLINELGVVPALIQAKNISEYVIRQAFGAILIINLVLFVSIYLCAPYLAIFFNEEQLTSITRVLAITFLISSFSSVPEAMLQREILFKGISIVQMITMVSGSLIVLALALLGFEVWALVLGQLARRIIATIGILIVYPNWIRPVFNFRGLGSLFKFGVNITLQRTLNYIINNFDVVIIGKLLGDHALGLYSIAIYLARLPMSKIMGILNQVALPAYSRLQDDVEQIGVYYFKTAQIACLIFFPLLWGLSSIAPEFVTVVLGEKWADATIVLQLLTFMIPFVVLSALIYPVINSLGYPGIGIRNLLTLIFLILPAILIGAYWDINGVCVGLVIATLAGWVINMHRSLGVINKSVTMLVVLMAPSLISAVVMYAVVITVKSAMIDHLTPLPLLIVMIVAGASVYLGLTFVFNKNTLNLFISLLKLKS